MKIFSIDLGELHISTLYRFKNEIEKEIENKKLEYNKIDISDTSMQKTAVKILKENGINTIGELHKQNILKLREIDGIGDRSIESICKTLGGYDLLVNTTK